MSAIHSSGTQARPGVTICFETGRIEADVANYFWPRLVGLLSGPPRALWLTDTWAVHSAGMGYDLDLCFVDRDWRVCRAVAGLRPWRIALCRGAVAVLEIPSPLRLPLPATGRQLSLTWR